MNGPMKNIEKAQVLTLKDQVEYQAGQVVSKTLAQNPHLGVTLFSFDKGEEISTHAAGETHLSHVLTASEKSPLTASTIFCMKVKASLCLRIIRMRFTVRSALKCCLS